MGKKDKRKKKLIKKTLISHKEMAFLTDKTYRFPPNIMAILCLLGLCLVFFWQVLFLNKTFFFEDLMTIFYHIRNLGNDAIRSGEFPLWNPYIFCGMPYVGDTQAALFYPFNLFFCFLPTARLVAYFVAIHFFIAGCTMYIYLRVLKLDYLSALLGAIIFSYSSYIFGEIRHPILIGVSVWLPLVFALIELMFRKKRLLYAVLAGVIFGIQFLAGHIQISYFIGISMTAYIFIKGVSLIKKKELTVIWLVSRYLIIISTGAALSAVQLLPFVELIRFSPRFGSNYEVASYFSLSPKEIGDLIIPNYCGTLDNIEKGFEFWNTGGYLGILPLILAVLGLIFSRNWYTISYAILVIFSLLAALGKYTPVNYLLFKFLPFYSNIHCPSRFLIFFTFSMAVLSGFGFSFLNSAINDQHRKKLIWVIISSIFITILFVSPLFVVSGTYYRNMFFASNLPFLNTQNLFLVILFISFGLIILRLKQVITPLIFRASIFLLLIFDLWTLGVNYAPLSPDSASREKPEIFKSLEQDKGFYRTITDFSVFNYLDFGESYKVCSATGYSSISLKYYMEYLWYNDHPESSLNDIEDERAYHIKNQTSKLMDMLNVKYILALKELEAGKFFECLLPNEDFLPRAWIVNNYEVIKDKLQILNRLNSKEFNPRESVILEEEPEWGQTLNMEFTDKFNIQGLTPANPQIIKYSLNQVVLKANVVKNGILVLSEVYYPGWKVYVNDKETKIYKANYVLRAVPLKKGTYKIRFVYDPFTFKCGLYITLFTIIALVIGLIKCLIRKS